MSSFLSPSPKHPPPNYPLNSNQNVLSCRNKSTSVNSC